LSSLPTPFIPSPAALRPKKEAHSVAGSHDLAYATGPSNVEVKDGKLFIYLKKETIVGNVLEWRTDDCHEPDIGDCILSDGLPNRRTFEYTGGKIVSKIKYKYGRFEIRCKIPHVDGISSAFWLYGYCGDEIDLFEFNSRDSNSSSIRDSRDIRMAVHRHHHCKRPDYCHRRGRYVHETDLSKDFHTYSVEWDEYKRKFMVDDRVIWTFYTYRNALGQEIQDCGDIATGIYFEDPTKITTKLEIIAQAGVNGFCYPDICARASFPQQMEIDYIKLWQKIPGSNSIILTPNPVRNKLNISVSDTIEQISSITVYSFMGFPVSEINNINTPSFELDMEGKQNGLYFVHAFIGGKIYVRKFIKD